MACTHEQTAPAKSVTLLFALTPSGIKLVDEQDSDWCPKCNITTLYSGESCAVCGRVWGYGEEEGWGLDEH